jgi:hypothetical protein
VVDTDQRRRVAEKEPPPESPGEADWLPALPPVALGPWLLRKRATSRRLRRLRRLGVPQNLPGVACRARPRHLAVSHFASPTRPVGQPTRHVVPPPSRLIWTPGEPMCQHQPQAGSWSLPSAGPSGSAPGPLWACSGGGGNRTLGCTVDEASPPPSTARKNVGPAGSSAGPLLFSSMLIPLRSYLPRSLERLACSGELLQ